MANYSKGKIAIPVVSGDIVINVTAVRSGPAYTNVWELGAINTRLNSADTDPVMSGCFVTDFIPITAEQMAGDLVLRSNKNLFDHNNLDINQDMIRMYSTPVKGTGALGLVAFGTKAYDAETGIYSITIPHSSLASYASTATYFRLGAKAQSDALTESYFEGCILTINEEITE